MKKKTEDRKKERKEEQQFFISWFLLKFLSPSDRLFVTGAV